MEDIAQRLVDLGYRRTRPEPECWRITQIGAPAPGAVSAREPAASRILARWRNRLSERKGPSPYQVCLALHIAAAGRHTALD
jgi:hypothetical protein